ncbi:MAG TPA: hypothetical protein VMW93_01650 [bacterium]|nr:hypothetical protein [bacterium]
MAKTTKILGLDPGETTGWALVEADGAGAGVVRVVDHGVVVAEGDPPSEADVLTTTRRELAAMLAVMKEDGVARVALEAPVRGRGFNDWLTNEVRGVCKEAVGAAGLTWCLVAQNTAKAAVGVKPARRKKGEPRLARNAVKEAVKVAVEARFGLAGLSYHEADAVACAVALVKEPKWTSS